MTEPNPWSTEGTDPWITPQLENETNLATRERDFRELYLTLIYTWLHLVTKRVIHEGRVDPAGVYTPDWSASIDKLIHGPILATIGDAYKPIMGTDYQYSRRAAVEQHLTTATSRMAKLPDYLYGLIRDQVVRGANTGLSAAQIAESVETLLMDHVRWDTMATTVTRVEIGSALQLARHDAFQLVAQLTNRALLKQWHGNLDRRIRPHHRAAHGQVVPVTGSFTVGDSRLRFPGDPLAPLEEIRLCRCFMILLDPTTGENITTKPL